MSNDEITRLRAVVDALREHRALNGRFWQPDISDDEAVEAAEQEARAWQAVVVALDQLDVSPDRGGHVNEWISPIDRHRHFGDAGRAECAVCCLEAERDHWRVLARREAAEADRLRAVVDGLRGYLSVDDVEDDESDVHAALREILAELDVSPTGDGT